MYVLILDTCYPLTAKQFSTLLLCMKFLSAGIFVESEHYVAIKLHLLRAMGFKNVASHPSLFGQTSYVLDATPELAWPCIDELLLLLDSAATISISQVMLGLPQPEDIFNEMLVGTVFIEPLLAFIGAHEDLLSIPYASAKALLHSLTVVLYKHNVDSGKDGKPLLRLHTPIRTAVRRALLFARSDAPYDLRQLGLSVAYAFIKTRPGMAGSFVPYVLLANERRIFF